MRSCMSGLVCAFGKRKYLVSIHPFVQLFLVTTFTCGHSLNLRLQVLIPFVDGFILSSLKKTSLAYFYLTFPCFREALLRILYVHIFGIALFYVENDSLNFASRKVACGKTSCSGWFVPKTSRRLKVWFQRRCPSSSEFVNFDLSELFIAFQSSIVSSKTPPSDPTVC